MILDVFISHQKPILFVLNLDFVNDNQRCHPKFWILCYEIICATIRQNFIQDIRISNIQYWAEYWAPERTIKLLEILSHMHLLIIHSKYNFIDQFHYSYHIIISRSVRHSKEFSGKPDNSSGRFFRKTHALHCSQVKHPTAFAVSGKPEKTSGLYVYQPLQLACVDRVQNALMIRT